MQELRIEGTSLATRDVVTVERLDGVPIAIGERTISASVLRWDGGSDCEMGTLGWDALVGCLIDFDGARVALTCPGTPPSIAEHAPPSIRVRAVEIAPACGVDEEILRRATHPAAPWTFRGWVDIVRSLGAYAGEVPEGELAEGVALVTRACRQLRDTEPVWRFAWRHQPNAEAFTLLAEVASEQPTP